MKQLLLLLMVFFTFVNITFAQTTQKPPVKVEKVIFNHCVDDTFRMVSCDTTTGIVKVRIKSLDILSQESLAAHKNARFNWFYLTERTWMNSNHTYDTAGVWVACYYMQHQKDSAYGEAGISDLKVTKCTVTGTIVTFYFKLSKEQMAVFKSVGGLPDEKTNGFEAGNFALTD